MQRESSNMTTDFVNSHHDNEPSIRQIVEKYAYYWKWFVLAIALAFSIAFVYLRYTTKSYAVTAQILLNEKGSSSPELAALSDAASSFIGGGSNAVVGDQIKIMQSRRLMYKTVVANRLNVNYFIQGKVINQETLAESSPVAIRFLQDSVYTSKDFEGNLKLEVLEDNQVQISESSFITPGNYSLNEVLETELGEVLLLPNKEAKTGQTVLIKLNPIMAAVHNFQSSLSIGPDSDKNSMIVNFICIDNIKQRGVLIINSIIKNYNYENIENGSKLAKATAKFINDRLELINIDLEQVDKNLQNYKVANSINNTEAEVGIYLNDVIGIDSQIIDYTAQLQTAQHLTSTLANNKNNLLPSNIGIQDAALSNAINNFNLLVLERQDYSKSMRIENPVMEALQNNINDSRTSILSSLLLYQNNIQSALDIVQEKKNNLNSSLSNLPEKERGFRDIARQQQIVESIYLFLLEKREEAEIRSAASIDNVIIVDDAYPKPIPVSPKKNIIYLGAFMLGIVIPFGAIQISSLLNNKIKDRSDFQKVFNGAFLGDVPRSKNKMIQGHDRSNLAEAMRIIRTNLNFILPKNDDCKVIYITSSIAGEGKTFFSVNLTQLLALAKKKVIVIGGDIRKPRLLQALNIDHQYTKGLSDLLAEPKLCLQDVVLRKPSGLLFDVLSSGTVPPNPAELLMEPKYNSIIEELKKEYDFIIVDTAPIGMVSDTQIIADAADATIFIARSNYLDKRMTTLLQDAYLNKKLKNIALVINDLDYDRGFGYGYGYGYGYEEKEKKKVFRMPFK